MCAYSVEGRLQLGRRMTMKTHVVLGLILLTISASCAEEEEPVLIHHLQKRQAGEEHEPIPYTAQDQHAPLPNQQGQAPESGSSGNAAAQNGSDNGNEEDPRSNRDYTGSSHGQIYVDRNPVDDLGRGSFSTPGQNPNAGAQIGSRGRLYYQYQPPISSGRRRPSQGQFYLSGHSQNNIPTQSRGAGVTRYTYMQPVASSGIRGQSGMSYIRPFAEGRGRNRSSNSSQNSQILGTVSGRAGAGVGGAVGAGEGFEGVGTPGLDNYGAGGNQTSVIGEEEPVVQVLPSERPVVNPQAEHQQQLRQRELERRRRLQQLRQQQVAAGGGQRRPSSGHQRPIYTSSQWPGSGYRQPAFYGGQQQQQRQIYGGLQPIYGGLRQPVYGSGGRRQQPYFNYGYSQPGVDQSGYDNECPNTGIRIQINGIPCEQAIDHYGSYLCYRHEYTSRECCIKCRGLKNPSRVGCEYGDHSGRCQQLQPYDCYDLRNRQGCCQSCERMRIAGARSGCEYGDMTPNCEQVRQNPGLCYIPENRYLCCQTCSTIRVTEDPECPWGDQSADLCQLFDNSGHIRINCYAPPIKRICCQSCRRLENWIPMNQPGCEYGDRPVTFNTGAHRNLNCTSFMRYYGSEQCSLNQAVATNCCYTCHRYTQG